MTTTTELILAPLAAIGSYALAVKAHEAFKFFRTMPKEGGVLPGCYGDFQHNQAWAERDCGNCRHENTCAFETSRRRSEVTSIMPSDKPKFDACPGQKMELVQHVTGNVLRTVGEEVEPLWMKKDCYATEQDPPLARTMPNMGGLDSAVPYGGPNYVAEEDLADEMKGLIHFYAEPAPSFFDESPARLDYPMGGDLAWDYRGLGMVAGDGTIWTAPDERCRNGSVILVAREIGKAARFGWTYKGEAGAGYVWVERA